MPPNTLGEAAIQPLRWCAGARGRGHPGDGRRSDYKENQFNLATQGEAAGLGIQAFRPGGRTRARSEAESGLQRHAAFDSCQGRHVERRELREPPNGSARSSPPRTVDQRGLRPAHHEGGAATRGRVARKMGIVTPLDADPAIALGGLKTGVSPLEMASSYGTLANGGYRVAPTGISVSPMRPAIIWSPTRLASRSSRRWQMKPHRCFITSWSAARVRTRISSSGLQERRVPLSHTVTHGSWGGRAISHGGVGRLSRGAGADDRRSRHQGDRRQLPGADLESLHEGGDRAGVGPPASTSGEEEPVEPSWRSSAPSRCSLPMPAALKHGDMLPPGTVPQKACTLH